MCLWPSAPHTLAGGLESLVVEDCAVTVLVRRCEHHEMVNIIRGANGVAAANPFSHFARRVYPPVPLQGRYPLLFQFQAGEGELGCHDAFPVEDDVSYHSLPQPSQPRRTRRANISR